MIRTLALALAALIAVPAAAGAQNYPAKPIRFIVPFATGSATDALARITGQKITALLGQPVTVEDIPGASGQIAAGQVQRAAADGYTLLISTNTTHAANQSMFKKLTYDPIGGFTPVTKLGDITLALALSPKVPAANVRELVDYAKKNPGKLTFGAGSSSSRMAVEMMKQLAGINIVYVAYKSNPQAMTDLLGGQTDMMFADITTTLPQIHAGSLKGLAVSSVKRSPLAPELPTMQEAGVAGYELTAWFAAFAPAKTPAATVDKLNQAFRTTLADKAVQDQLLNAGIEPAASSPEELQRFVASETEKWAKIVRAAGIEPE
jgi:tripartite-type tricarboxylate transporter receptor subunit TctC